MSGPKEGDLFSYSLQEVIGVGLRSTLGSWINLLHDADSPIVDALNALNRQDLDVSERTRIWNLLDALRANLTAGAAEMTAAQQRLERLKEVLEIRKAEVEFKAAIVEAWPADAVAERFSYLGAALFASGGAAYALTGYPHEITTSLVPPVGLWILGLALTLYGLGRLISDHRERLNFFKRQFNLELSEKV